MNQHNRPLNEENRNLREDVAMRPTQGQVDDLSSKTRHLDHLEKHNAALSAENRGLRENLAFAKSVIDELFAQIKAYDDLLGRSRAKAVMPAGQVSKSRLDEPTVANFDGGSWIGDLWLSSPADQAILGEAENAWKQGNAQKALNILTMQLKEKGRMQPDLPKTILKINLLSAAILQHKGATQRALNIANDCLAAASSGRYWDLMGICNFIRARCQLDLEKYEEAKQSLLFAEFTPGYRDKVKQYLENINEITEL